MKRSTFSAAAICALPLLLVACQTPPPAGREAPPARAGTAPKGVSPALAEATAGAAAGMPSQQDKLQAHIYRGTGVVVKVGSSRVDLQACKLEYSIVSPK